MADLCPPRIRGRYFSRHALCTALVAILAPFAVSVLLDRGFGGVPAHAADGSPLAYLQTLGFAVLFTVASIFGLLAWSVLRAQPDPGPADRPAPQALSFEWILQPFRDAEFRPLLVFVLIFGATNGLANPFWASFQLEQLGLPYSYVSGIFVALQGIVTALALSFWGRVNDRYGNRAVLALTLVLIFVSPLFYVVADRTRWWLMLVDAAVQGVGWAGYNVAILNLVFSITPRDKREVYYAAYVTVLGTAQAATSVLAGSFVSLLPDSLLGLALHPRQQVFLVTAAARFFCLVFFLRALGPPRNPRVRAALERVHALFRPTPAPAPVPGEAV